MEKEGSKLSISSKYQTQATGFYILLIYIACQLSGLLLLIPQVKQLCLSFINAQGYEANIILTAWWATITFAIALVISFLLIRRDPNFWNVFKGKTSISYSIFWGILGFFLVFLGQSVGALIEAGLGINHQSENTQAIMKIVEISPIMILSSVVFGPILEELVFRRVIFGSLIQTQNFWISGLISSIIFAAIHLDFTHIIIYTISGLIFAFLYFKTKRLLTPIIAHMLLNGFVTVLGLLQ